MKRHKRTVLLSLLALAAAWCLWYSRPVDIHFLTGQQQIRHLECHVTPQADFPIPTVYSFLLDSEDPEAQAIMEQLETLRFHRSPLEPLLRLFSSRGGSGKTVDTEKDYFFCLSFSGENWENYLSLNFHIDEWRYGLYAGLPLYIFSGQEKGRELGKLLTEIAKKTESNS